MGPSARRRDRARKPGRRNHGALLPALHRLQGRGLSARLGSSLGAWVSHWAEPNHGGVSLAGRDRPRTPPSPRPFHRPRRRKGRGKKGGKVVFCGKGRKEGKAKKKREQKHGGLRSGRARRGQRLDIGPPAAPAAREPLGRQLPSLQAVPLETRPRGGAGAEGPPESRPCLLRVPRPRRRRLLAPGSRL